MAPDKKQRNNMLNERIKGLYQSGYLKEADDFLEQAKVRLLFRVALMSFFTLLFSLPTIFLILPLAALISGLGLILMMLVPLVLKHTGSVSFTSKFMLLLSFLITFNVHLIINKPDGLGVGAWYVVIAVCGSFLLGKKW